MLFSLLYTVASIAIAVLYPAFMSFKSLKSGGADTRKWLEYWAVYSLFAVAEWTVLDQVLPSTWLVVLSKLALLGWLVFSNGASTLYQSKLEKLLVAHEKTIDEQLEKVSVIIAAKGKEAYAQGMELVKSHAGSLFQKLAAKNAPPASAGPPADKPSTKAE